MKIIISIMTIDLPEEEEHIVEAVELEWEGMPVNLDLHIRTLKSNSKRQRIFKPIKTLSAPKDI